VNHLRWLNLSRKIRNDVGDDGAVVTEIVVMSRLLDDACAG